MTRTHLLLILLCLARLAGGTSSSTNCECLQNDDSLSYRSVWSILANCGLTLLICVWHAIHPDIPGADKAKVFFARAPWIFLTSFLAPEAVVAVAAKEWCEAHHEVKQFRDNGYELSITHGHFVRMGGFVYGLDGRNPRNIDGKEFLRLCREGEVTNPFFTEKEIKDRSTSDCLAKVVFSFQLLWFTLQVVVRGSKGLAITLVELDTVCMGVTALLYIFFWWDKPHRPECPQVFCFSGKKKKFTEADLSNAWKPGPGYWEMFTTFLRTRLACKRNTRMIDDDEKEYLANPDHRRLGRSKPGLWTAMVEKLDPEDVLIGSLFTSWTILGALHLIAWNFEFPTEAEKIAWRIASFILAASPLAGFVLFFPVVLLKSLGWVNGCFSTSAPASIATFVFVSAPVSRAVLVGLMLASLRALPVTAHQIVPWTTYIPHF